MDSLQWILKPSSSPQKIFSLRSEQQRIKYYVERSKCDHAFGIIFLLFKDNFDESSPSTLLKKKNKRGTSMRMKHKRRVKIGEIETKFLSLNAKPKLKKNYKVLHFGHHYNSKAMLNCHYT